MPIVGDVLADRYRLEAVLGVGGMASVYRAMDLRLDRQVAVKVLVANLAADPRFAERFDREAGAMAGFSHPNVAAVYDVERGDPATGLEPFYVMEYCEGGSLADRLRTGGRLPPAEVVTVVAAVSDGLAELHRRGLIHRDIKPANILFGDGRPKLADFGIAWNLEPSEAEPLTLPGSMLGTAPYLAPELDAGVPPSAASDVYALGVTIFQALTGQYPQPTSGADAGVGSPPVSFLPVSAAAPDLGQGFDAALARALDRDPAARPSPTELAEELATGVEIWGVARPNPGAVAATRSPQGPASGVDMDAPTRIAPAAAWPASAPVVIPPLSVPPPPVQTPSEVPKPASGQAALASSRSAVRHSTSSSIRRRFPEGLALAVVLAILALFVLSRLLGGSSGQAATSAPATARASSVSSSSPATSPSASPLANREAILADLAAVDAAIEAARGGKDGLTGRDAGELTQLVGAVRTAVDRGDLAAAATAAQQLSDRAKALVKGLDKERRNGILTAVDTLQAALPPP